MTNSEPGSHITFENLKEIEAKLFKGNRKCKTGEDRKPEGPGTGRDTWRLNQEILDAKKECAALKYELDAVRILLTEQNVLTVSTSSVLKELKGDFNRQQRLLGEREAELSDLSPEISRLNSELNMEKRRNGELRKNLDREAALREDLENLPPGSARNKDLEGKAKTPELDLRDKFTSLSRYRREGKPGRFVRGY